LRNREESGDGFGLSATADLRGSGGILTEKGLERWGEDFWVRMGKLIELLEESGRVLGAVGEDESGCGKNFEILFFHQPFHQSRSDERGEDVEMGVAETGNCFRQFLGQKSGRNGAEDSVGDEREEFFDGGSEKRVVIAGLIQTSSSWIWKSSLRSWTG
jgi:hypothetical protein